LLCIATKGQNHYNEVSFYVCAHQDDWQLFMGTDVYNDIVDYDEVTPNTNGKKVVIIYTTAGNLHDDDDTKSCNCKDPYNQNAGPVPYWKVREKGSKSSVHLAACRVGGWGTTIPYPENQITLINGHPVTRYQYRNTVSYYLRIKAGTNNYANWTKNRNTPAETVDSSSTYDDWTDFVNTLYYIFKNEIDSSVNTNKATFHFPDINEQINPGDHSDHLLAGRGTNEAAKILGSNMNTCYKEQLYIDYHTKSLPINLTSPDAQNEAGMTSVYCLALLDYNAWPEWSLYHDWTARNYYRTITTCEDAVPDNILAQDSLDKLNIKVYPSPANKQLTIRFNIPTNSVMTIKVVNALGAIVFAYNGPLVADTYTINTSSFPNGIYTVSVGKDSVQLSTASFEVLH
jgi:Secretion system C-terminal sorting domain